MKIYLASMVVTLMALSGCAPKVMILQSPVVSMKVSDAGKVKELKGGKVINERWCGDDKPVVVNDDGSTEYGLVDQVTWKAHKSSKADLFVDAKYYTQAKFGGVCVMMTAKAVDAK